MLLGCADLIFEGLYEVFVKFLGGLLREKIEEFSSK